MEALFILIWIVCGIVGLILGDKKGMPGTGALLGFSLGIIGIVILITLEDKYKTCPGCGNRLRPDAIRCLSCGYDVRNVTVKKPPEFNQTLPQNIQTDAESAMGTESSSDWKRCPYCAEEIRAAAIKCKHCGSMLQVPVQVSMFPGQAAPLSYVRPQASSDATTCLILGLLSICFLGAFTGIPALHFAKKARIEMSRNPELTGRGMVEVGEVTAWIGIAFFGLGILLGFCAVIT